MATATKPTTIRLEDGLKNQAVEILDSIGISYNSFVSLATHQLINQGKIPFECVPSPTYVPNEKTHESLVAAEAKNLGLIPDDAQTFSNSEDLIAFLDEE